MEIDTHQPILSTISSYNIEQLLNIHPRLCILHKWSHYDGYGIHLTCNEHWCGLYIDDIEPNSPAESAGLLRDDIILAVNGHSIENDDFFVILSSIEYELEQDQIRFLVIDPHSAELAQRYQLKIDEYNENCIRTETSPFIESSNKIFEHTNNSDQAIAENSSYNELDDMDELFSNLDSNNSLKSEPRMCSITLRPGVDSIGISLQSDTDFSHIITQVQSNSLADHAGIEQNDCIISLNNTLLLHIPFEDVLYFLAKSHNETKLDFLVAKKSYVLKLSQNHLTLNTNDQIFSSSSNSIEKNRSSILTHTQILEQLYHKYNYEQYDDLNYNQNILNAVSIKSIQSSPVLRIGQQDNHQISQSNLHLEGMSVPTESAKDTARITVPYFSDDDYLSILSEKTSEEEPVDFVVTETSQTINDESSDDKKEEAFFDSMETSVSNVSTLENTFDHEENKSNHSVEHHEEQPETSTSSNSDQEVLIISTDSERIDSTQQPEIPMADRQVEDQSVASTFYISDINETDELDLNTLEQYVENENYQFADQQQQNNIETTPITSAKMVFATMPISELPNHGYELHNIKLMQPTETVPVGFKLSKQTDPLQYIMTVIVEQSKADIAGLKVDDWLIKIEDNDIRLTDSQDVLQDIYRLFNSVGFINMLIARKKSSIIDEQPTSVATTNILPSIGLSNPNQPILKEYPIIQSIDPNLDKIRHITLKETSGLYFNSFIPDNTDQIHFIINIQPISAAYRAGLRNNDRILTVNDIDVKNTSQEDLRLMILKSKPVHLTVMKDSKYIESIENFKRNQIRKSSSSTISESIDSRQSKDLNTILFTDDQGPVYIKQCIIKKEPPYDALGFLLYYEDNVHIINNVEINLPAYNSGLRDCDIILFVNKKSIQQLTHDDVIILLRSLVLSNQTVDLIIMKKNDIQRYKNYQRKKIIDWNMIFSKIYDDSINKIQTDEEYSYVNQQSNTSSSLLDGARICVLETFPNRSIGFTIEGGDPPPYTICKIEKDSSAEKAGLQRNDALLSINGKSVTEISYEDTIQIIKDALQQKIIQFVVKQSSIRKKSRPKRGSDSSLSYSSDEDSSDGSTIVDEPAHRGTNALQQYQQRRSKELSYVVRLCHLNAINIDGTPASSFGFEITGDPEYQYPVISRVQPKLPGELAGLQVDDVLLKVNNRKTKGAAFDKIKKAIEKAKRDGRIEMLVVDKETFNYCMQTNRKFKEPYIKVKHIFPRSRSSISYQSLPSIAARASFMSQEDLEQSINGISSVNVDHRAIQSENEADDLKSPNFDLSSTINSIENTRASFPHDISMKFIDPARRLSQRKDTSSTIQNVSNTTQEIRNETATDQSIIDFVLNAINNFFQNIGSEKSMNPDYDIPPDRTNNSKTPTPLPSTVRLDQNFSKEISSISQSHNKIHSNQSSALYDYIKDPRRCVLKIDYNKGLGFVLSATGDYDHTITAVDKNSVAEVAGLQINDEVVEINGIDVRNIKYEQVVDMLISAMRTNDTIEMYVINNHVYSSTMDTNKGTNIPSLLNGNNNNNNNNNNLINEIHTKSVLGDDLKDKNNKMNVSNRLNQQTMDTSYPDLHDRLKYLNNISDRGLRGSVPTLSTGITGSPKDCRSTSSKNSATKLLNISKKDAPIARLCRIRKFPSSPFYGFFLCGNRKKLGRVSVSNVIKNSPASICGLRDGDRIIEVNGINIQTLTYETILNKIKLHMEHHDLELLVLDKKSLRWYRRQNHPITSQTLPTIVHIEPIINDINSKTQCSSEL